MLSLLPTFGLSRRFLTKDEKRPKGWKNGLKRLRDPSQQRPVTIPGSLAPRLLALPSKSGGDERGALGAHLVSC